MRKLRECLRLHFEAGMNQSQLSRMLHLGRGSIQNHLHRFSSNGLSWDECKKFTDDELERHIYPQSETSSQTSRPLPDFAHIRKEKKRPGVTLQLLWEEYIEDSPEGLRRSQFCWQYRQWLKKQNGSMHQNHKGGEKVFVDYSGKRPELIDSETGEIRKVELFVMCWGASHDIYAEAQENQGLENWMMGHVRAFEYFDCVPKLTVVDNLKSGVDKAHRYDPDVNRTYQQLSEHYGFGVLPTRPAAPKDKAKVENAVLIVQRWILARLRNRQFFSLAELNRAIGELVDVCNDKRFQKMPYTRKELFLDIDKPNALPLPENRFIYCDWVFPTISPDYHVSVDKSYYSVPWEYYGKDVSVRLVKHSVEVYHGRKRIAVHQRSIKPYTYTTNNNHLPQKHQKYAWWTLENLMKRAKEIGNSTETLIKKIIKSKVHPLQGYRPAQGVLRLANVYGNTRLESACEIALMHNFLRVRQVTDILKNGKDKQENDTEKTIVNSKQIRGKQYYAQKEIELW